MEVDRSFSTSPLCSICQQMDFSVLMFGPQDAKLLFEGTPNKTFNTVGHLIDPPLGRLSDIMERAKSWSLCTMIISILKRHVDDDLLARLEREDLHSWRLTSRWFGSFVRRIVNPPYKRHYVRVGLSSSKEFPDGQSRTDGVVLDHAFQGASRVIPDVRDLLNNGHDSLAEELKPSGRTFAAMCNVMLFRKWLRDCEKGHDCVHKTYRTGIQMHMRLVDTEEMRIVRFTLPEGELPRYCSLSYVWGMNLVDCRLTKQNLPDLMQNHGIMTLELPRTILDAIYLVRDLGVRFLWIDLLCILQDDPEDQKQQIPQMRQVYSRSLLTIIAASGDNANSGLSGLRFGDRTFTQDVVVLENMSLLSCSAPVEHGTSSIDITNSKWDSRGWTMQERMFSMRCLIFTKEQVYWECQGASWCEGTRFETSPRFRFEGNMDTPLFLRHNFLDDVNDSHKGTASNYRYKKTIEHYTRRQLSFDHDALNAFTGVIDFFQAESALSCFWALPVADFESSLCWHAIRIIKPRGEGDFPSWSWLGWREHVEFFQQDQGFHLIHVHKVVSRDGSRDLIPVGSDQVPHHPLFHGSPQPLQPRRSPVISDVFPAIVPLLRDDFHLVFWTTTASFQIGYTNITPSHPGENEEYQYTEIYPTGTVALISDQFTRDKSKAWKTQELSKGAVGFYCGALDESVKKAAGGYWEFVLLSKCRQEEHYFPPVKKPLLVMLVSWQRGLARRLALGLVSEMAWLAAERREKLILLG